MRSHPANRSSNVALKSATVYLREELHHAPGKPDHRLVIWDVQLGQHRGVGDPVPLDDVAVIRLVIEQGRRAALRAVGVTAEELQGHGKPPWDDGCARVCSAWG